MVQQRFNTTQIKQLGKLFDKNNKTIFTHIATEFDKNNKMLSEHTATIVDVLSQTIEVSEKRTNDRITREISEVKTEMRQGFKKVDDDIKNLATTTPSKYQVQRLEKAVFGPTS